MNEEQMSMIPQTPRILFSEVQPLIIEERLKEVSEEIKRRTAEAKRMAVTASTLATVKATRAELNKELKELDAARIAFKKRCLEPYTAFETAYKQYISDVYREADEALKIQIDSVERQLSVEKEEKLRKYYAELLASYGLSVEDWPFDHSNIRVLRSTSDKALKDAVKAYVEKLLSDIDAISRTRYPDEVMAEYKLCGSISAAQIRVSDRHNAAEQARQERIARENMKTVHEEAATKVEAVLPPEEVKPEPVYQTAFQVEAELSKLKALKQYMIDNGITFKAIKI